MALTSKKRRLFVARSRHWKAYVDQWTDVITLVKNRKGGHIVFNPASAEDVIAGLSGEEKQLALDVWIPLKAKLAAFPDKESAPSENKNVHGYYRFRRERLWHRRAENSFVMACDHTKTIRYPAVERILITDDVPPRPFCPKCKLERKAP